MNITRRKRIAFFLLVFAVLSVSTVTLRPHTVPALLSALFASWVFLSLLFCNQLYLLFGSGVSFTLLLNFRLIAGGTIALFQPVGIVLLSQRQDFPRFRDESLPFAQITANYFSYPFVLGLLLITGAFVTGMLQRPRKVGIANAVSILFALGVFISGLLLNFQVVQQFVTGD